VPSEGGELEEALNAVEEEDSILLDPLMGWIKAAFKMMF
jgi:hypothetical protein